MYNQFMTTIEKDDQQINIEDTVAESMKALYDRMVMIDNQSRADITFWTEENYIRENFGPFVIRKFTFEPVIEIQCGFESITIQEFYPESNTLFYESTKDVLQAVEDALFDLFTASLED
jgi:hypothetical protein